jgi:hypothetical protein
MSVSMKFSQNEGSITIGEAIVKPPLRYVRIFPYQNPTYQQNYIDLDEHELRELRKWTTIQIRKLTKK